MLATMALTEVHVLPVQLDHTVQVEPLPFHAVHTAQIHIRVVGLLLLQTARVYVTLDTMAPPHVQFVQLDHIVQVGPPLVYAPQIQIQQLGPLHALATLDTMALQGSLALPVHRDLTVQVGPELDVLQIQIQFLDLPQSLDVNA